jgi:uncharacterized protein (TIGR02145 family)
MSESAHTKILAALPLWLCLFGSFKASPPEVKIGTLIWTTENLDVGSFRNGDIIPEARTADQWAKAGKEQKPAWCYIEFQGNQSRYYGCFYNWYAVSDPRGLAPRGYHLPTKQEFLNLIKAIGRQENEDKLKSKDGWTNLQGVPDNGTDEFGFNARPSGIRAEELGKMQFVLSGMTGCWWSLTQGESVKATCLRIDYLAAFVYQEQLGVGMPVRLVKDY